MIRAAAPGDFPAIRAIIRHAFGRADEANLVEALREDGDMLYEFVAQEGIGLLGHIAFSRLPIERSAGRVEAAALAPLSVLPAFQRQGLGLALMEASLAQCRALGCKAVLVLGRPSYYPRAGFRADLAEPLEAPFSGPSFMALEMEPGVLKAGGRVRYAKAFGV